MIEIENESYASMEEIALILQVNQSTIYTWLSEKRIPSIKLGKRRIFNLSSINEWLKSNIE